METVEISSRSDFALWGNRAGAGNRNVRGSCFAMAARDMDEEELAKTAAALGKAISDAMLEVFDGLIDE